MISDKLERLPDAPGVYIYRDRAGEPIYIGKAKSLRQRVRSYFQPSAQHPPRIAGMVEEAADLEIITVATELEALILESNLIKRYRPRHNVLLRDDKNFPFLKLSVRDPYPRVTLVRKARLDGNLYFGPMLPTSVARRSLKLIPRFFRVATCNEIFDGKRRPCLYYHLDQCLAPCAGKTTPEEYGAAVRDTRLFLEGRHRELERSLREKMHRASAERRYEEAARFRDTLRTVERLAERQQMASVGLENQDCLALYREGDRAVLELFQVRGGRVQGRREFVLDAAGMDDPGLYEAALLQYYADVEPPPEILVPLPPTSADSLAAWLAARRGRKVRLRVPHRGGRRRLLATVQRNAALAFESRFRARHTHGVDALESLAEALGLDEPPRRIECFDVSNIQGSDSVASMVVWEEGKPRRSAYRSFSIRGVEGPDDFASIAEAVTRRYRRLLKESRPLPDLVLIDGGAGQLGAAVRALASVGLPMLPVIALAKREEEIYLQGAAEPARLDRDSPALRLVQRIRDEAHRFAVTRHRRKRARRTLRTKLTDLPGIGPVTARKLLRHFGSVRAVQRADTEEIAEVAGRRAARAVRDRFGDPATG